VALLGKIIVSCNAWIKKNPKLKWARINPIASYRISKLIKEATQSAIQSETRVGFRPGCHLPDICYQNNLQVTERQLEGVAEETGYDPKNEGRIERMGLVVELYLPNDAGKSSSATRYWSLRVFDGQSRGRLGDYITDLSITASPGFWPFITHKNYIDQLIDKAGGMLCDRHSLGGALAQYTAMCFLKKSTGRDFPISSDWPDLAILRGRKNCRVLHIISRQKTSYQRRWSSYSRRILCAYDREEGVYAHGLSLLLSHI